jgi:HSP20 family protein
MAGTLTRWDPFAELGELRTRFDRMFDELTDGHSHGRTPAIDVERDNGNLVVRADIPGIKPEDVKIEVEDDILTVSGEHEERKEQKDKHHVRRERRYGSFRRSMALPAGVDAKNIKAKTRDGVVEVTIPAPQGGEQGDGHDQADRRLMSLRRLGPAATASAAGPAPPRSFTRQCVARPGSRSSHRA